MGGLMMQAALALAQRGIAVVPIMGKSPLHKGGHGWYDATTNLAEILTLFESRNHTGVGVATGGASGVWVLDVDGRDGLASMRVLIRDHGPLPKGPVVHTGNFGWHLYFSMPFWGHIGCPVGVLPGIDIRGHGGGVVAPPSVHPDTKRHYLWRDPGMTLLDMEPPAPPEWLLELVTQAAPEPAAERPGKPAQPCDDRKAEEAMADAERRISTAGNGQQRATLFRVSIFVGAELVAKKLIDRDKASDRLIDAGLAMVNYKKSKWTSAQIGRVVSDGLTYGEGRATDAA